MENYKKLVGLSVYILKAAVLNLYRAATPGWHFRSCSAP